MVTPPAMDDPAWHTILFPGIWVPESTLVPPARLRVKLLPLMVAFSVAIRGPCFAFPVAVQDPCVPRILRQGLFPAFPCNSDGIQTKPSCRYSAQEAQIHIPIPSSTGKLSLMDSSDDCSRLHTTLVSDNPSLRFFGC